MDVTESEGIYQLLGMKSSRKGKVLSVSTVRNIVADAMTKDSTASRLDMMSIELYYTILYCTALYLLCRSNKSGDGNLQQLVSTTGLASQRSSLH